MTLAIILGAIFVYLVSVAIAARPIYGYMRAHRIDSYARRYPLLAVGPVSNWVDDAIDPWATPVDTFFIAGIWPVSLPVWAFVAAVRYQMRKTRRLSNAELREQAEQQRAYIRKLEREAGISDV